MPSFLAVVRTEGPLNMALSNTIGGGVVIDAGELAAHDARHGDGAFFVGDDQHLLAERAVHAVQRFNVPRRASRCAR